MARIHSHRHGKSHQTRPTSKRAPTWLTYSAAVVTDKFSGQSKGFGFVEMADASAADAAIKSLDGTVVVSFTSCVLTDIRWVLARGLTRLKPSPMVQSRAQKG